MIVCHGCIHLKMTPVPAMLLDYDYACKQTGADIPDPRQAPPSCPYRAIPSGAIKQRADALTFLLDQGMPVGPEHMGQLQADVAQMVGDADETLLGELHALQQRLGTYPVR